MEKSTEINDEESCKEKDIDILKDKQKSMKKILIK